MPREIYFVQVSNQTWGSYQIRGEQLSRHIPHWSCCSLDDVTKTSNAILVFIKWLPDLEVLERLRERGNLLVYDMIDALSLEEKRKERLALLEQFSFDAIIFPNSKIRAKYEGLTSRPTLIHHHLHDDFSPIKSETFSQPEFVYAGQRDECSFLEELPGVSVVNPREPNWIAELQNYNCHLSLRENIYKPATKLIVAIGLGANIIMCREPAFLDILPEYPFYVDFNKQAVLEMFEKVRSAYGTPLWSEALDMLQSKRERFRVESILKEYSIFFESL